MVAVMLFRAGSAGKMEFLHPHPKPINIVTLKNADANSV